MSQTHLALALVEISQTCLLSHPTQTRLRILWLRRQYSRHCKNERHVDNVHLEMSPSFGTCSPSTSIEDTSPTCPVGEKRSLMPVLTLPVSTRPTITVPTPSDWNIRTKQTRLVRTSGKWQENATSVTGSGGPHTHSSEATALPHVLDCTCGFWPQEDRTVQQKQTHM